MQLYHVFQYCKEILSIFILNTLYKTYHVCHISASVPGCFLEGPFEEKQPSHSDEKDLSVKLHFLPPNGASKSLPQTKNYIYIIYMAKVQTKALLS